MSPQGHVRNFSDSFCHSFLFLTYLFLVFFSGKSLNLVVGPVIQDSSANEVTSVYPRLRVTAMK